MSEKKILERAGKNKKENKVATTAGSKKQAVAPGLSKTRRAGIDFSTNKGKSSEEALRNAGYYYESKESLPYRNSYVQDSSAFSRLLEKEDHHAISREFLSQFAQNQSRWGNF